MKLFICPTCSNEMSFNSTDGILTCHHCKKDISVTDYEHHALGSTKNAQFISDYSSGNVDVTSDTSAPNIIDNSNNNNKYYIPFKIDDSLVPSLFKRKLTNLLTPSSFKKILKQKAFKKMYIPIWTHEVVTDANLSAVCTNFDNNVTNYYSLDKKISFMFSNLNNNASSNNNTTGLSMLFPYELSEAKPLENPDSLKHDNAEIIAIDISDDMYNDDIESFTTSVAKNKLNSFTTAYSSSHNKEFSTETKILSSRILYLPVWSITHKRGAASIYINGQTGNIAGTLPISKIRLSVSFLCMLIIIFTILNLPLFFLSI